MDQIPLNSNLLRLLVPSYSALLPRALTTDEVENGDATLSREALNNAKTAVSNLSLRLAEANELHTACLASLLQSQPTYFHQDAVQVGPPLALYHTASAEVFERREQSLQRFHAMATVHQLHQFCQTTVPAAFSLFHRRLDEHSTRLLRLQRQLLAVATVFGKAKSRTQRLLTTRVSYFAGTNDRRAIFMPQPLHHATIETPLGVGPGLAMALLKISHQLETSLQAHLDHSSSTRHLINKLQQEEGHLFPDREMHRQTESRIAE